MRVLPILFNTDMVCAILDGRKTATRRAVRYKYSNTEMKMRTDKYGTYLIEIQKNVAGVTHGKHPDGSTWHKILPFIEKISPYKKGDILYVRETWAFLPCMDCVREGTDCGRPCVTYEDKDSVSDGCFVYRVDHPDPGCVSWSPSIHMPKAAARIWLRVTDVRAERLQDITNEQILKEGCNADAIRRYIKQMPGETEEQVRAACLMEWQQVWNSTVKKSELDRYSWDANPWVWATEFERCEKPEEG